MFEFNICLEVESRQKEKTQRSSSKVIVIQLHNYTIIQRMMEEILFNLIGFLLDLNLIFVFKIKYI